MGDDLEESNKKSTAKETVHLSWKRWKDWRIEKFVDVEPSKRWKIFEGKLGKEKIVFKDLMMKATS